ncbi:hypothetical protein BSZ18_18630 [Bradyrhizobium canariense]|jgi:hypothetical protein|uniref:Uncharacterized protein n=2 Tax=Bradyrhizobium canariense TaxID=255045 RepID=A0A1X3H630_9BRAD|nr:hypothetical protein BSZ21_26490 [Bradyrhizobium canariense]OSI80750.1 hypothetical protein BSZ23_09585 [Bradyrhizobium canariense]OSI85007.1 hypothetical protein BSZ24_33270 [Bradyrhizobium canariense]OSI88130.1 hypothetical protein BSZ25_25430 [Bradyrhizobium canariense]OSJ00477.1 hypothetical protein BSZ16_25170 [Bradyrhizobium canariense]
MPGKGGPTLILALDETFGEALAPDRVDPLEGELRPQSLHRLSRDTARLLKQLMVVTEKGLGVTRYVYSELPILWVVDSVGKFWFSIEEVVNATTREYIFPRARYFRTAEGTQKLGHPALIEAGPGRIGGEILFDLHYKPSAAWCITNGSGRYGTRPGRTPDHLANAAKEFARYGIKLQDVFIPTMARNRT